MSTNINRDQIIEAVASMSVTDVMDLIAAMEKKFGVSAATINTITNDNNNVSDISSEVVEEKTEFDVILKSIGANKIAVIKAVRSAIGLGLKDAKDLVESSPVALKENISKDDAESLRKALEEAGAEVEIK